MFINLQIVTRGMGGVTRTKEVSFADISKFLAEREDRGINIKESRIGTGNFTLHAITLPYIERASLESKFGRPHDTLNGYEVYKVRDGQGKVIEAVYIKYIRDFP